MTKKLLTLLLAGILTVTGLGSVTHVFGAEGEETVKSYLTGENVPASVGRRRPVAFMMDNVQQACPQSGISRAGVVYEAPVEGEITRLMAILEDYDDLDKIGAVRSCRDYYIYYANEFDAIYSHFGQAVYALRYFDQNVIDHLNGLELDGTVYYRTSDRQAPHNAYTGFERLQSGIQNAGIRQQYKEGYQGHYRFAGEGQEVTLDGGTDARVVKLENFSYNHPWFEYDDASKEYKRYQYGAAQVDELTNEQLTCDNIILQYSSCPAYDAQGYLNIDTTSGGAGKYITRGKAIDIQWKKDSEWGATRYFNMDNQEIQINTGVTWVEIIQDNKVDSIVYQQ